MDRYEEALAKARVEYEKARKQGYAWLMNLLEGMFPELKESEDERISRLIYCIIRDTPEVDDVLRENGRSVIEALAYLEKQKDLDKMIVVSPEVWDNAINDAYKNGKKNGEKQKEQKFTEKQDYSDLNDLERAIHRGFLVVGVENVPVTIIKETAQDCLAWMKPQKGANGNEKEIPNEQKPAEWSKEDEEMRINILQEIANIKDVFPKINIQPEFDWLKSLPERFNLQPKQEWTIEDAKPGDILHTSSTASSKTFIFKGIRNDEHGSVECFCCYDSEDGFRKGEEELIGWKTDKYRLATPKQCIKLGRIMGKAGYIFHFETNKLQKLNKLYWKPSEEQMDILNWVANILLNHDGIVEKEVAKKLQSLYNDLKKLM